MTPKTQIGKDKPPVATRPARYHCAGENRSNRKSDRSRNRATPRQPYTFTRKHEGKCMNRWNHEGFCSFPTQSRCRDLRCTPRASEGVSAQHSGVSGRTTVVGSLPCTVNRAVAPTTSACSTRLLVTTKTSPDVARCLGLGAESPQLRTRQNDLPGQSLHFWGQNQNWAG